ncbi:MAG: LUD domain-containing protein, partial [Candidatus Diapherotrites archaeon]|nr:LUD domain-containing protein [Candidatus Diapherotrites archaeon]
MKWDKLADGKKLTKAADALEKNGFKVFVVQNRQEAFQKALELIPAGAEVMDLTSTTLD